VVPNHSSSRPRRQSLRKHRPSFGSLESHPQRHGSGDLRDFAENTETARILSFNKQKKTAAKK